MADLHFGKTSINPEGLAGYDKKQFLEEFRGFNFAPHDIEDVWKEVSKRIPKKEKSTKEK